MQEEDLDILEAQIKDIKYTVPFFNGTECDGSVSGQKYKL